MKKNAVLFLAIFAFANLSAQPPQSLVPQNLAPQKKTYDWKNMSPEKRQEIISKMSPEERTKLLREFREDMMLSGLQIPQEKQDDFKRLYAEYQEKQRDIKDQFHRSENYDSLTDEEARKELNESFELGKQLIENRKLYAEKFLKILTPQQVLQMYQTEGKIREKVLDRKHDKDDKSATSSLRQRKR
ncbi:MAG: hypothetical protein LBE36_00575 [Flavobacteriaceae bacterium]|nr:hypothetical protein [Flavobacteriaceae bacterium]